MRKTALCLILLILICSCGRIPEPVGYPHSEQQKMQAAHHWNVLANDVAGRINNELIISDNMDTPVYVKATCGSEDSPCDTMQTSAFNEAFRDLLITELFSFGVPVQQHSSDDAISVHYKVQVVRHNAKRIRTLQPGLISGLSAAVMVMRNAPAEFLALAAGSFADYANQTLVLNGHNEVLITTSMINREHYLFRASDIYYINDHDSNQYRQHMPQATDIQISSPREHRERGGRIY